MGYESPKTISVVQIAYTRTCITLVNGVRNCVCGNIAKVCYLSTGSIAKCTDRCLEYSRQLRNFRITLSSKKSLMSEKNPKKQLVILMDHQLQRNRVTPSTCMQFSLERDLQWSLYTLNTIGPHSYAYNTEVFHFETY